jgi:two-component system sensor histidine kinase PilS (NtrC family)
VTSVLELSRRQQAQPSAIDLRGWLTDFCNEYRDSNRLAPARLQLDFPATKADELVRVDARHLGQIIRNLCDNGFKHGGAERREAHVSIALGRNPSSGECTVTVTDDGPGVAPEHRGAIFEPFFTTSSSGTGLGLYASSELAQANGMRLDYLDESGPGGRFRLTFNE